MIATPDASSLHRADGIDEVPQRTLYRILQLRESVFVVEQECAFLDLDGHDLDPATRQLWFETAGGEVVAALRILDRGSVEPGLACLSRIVARPDWRGRGLAGALVAAALDECAGRPIVLDAQSRLTPWYARFGFVVAGEEVLEDGLPHTPMRREAG